MHLCDCTNNQSEQRGGNNDNNNGDPDERDATKDIYTKGHIVIPYTQGVRESIKNIYKRYGIKTHFKRNRTIKNMLVKPKDKDPLDRKCGDIYWYQYGEPMCDDEYISETSRTFGEDIRNISKTPHPSLDTSTSQDTLPTLITSPL